MKSLPFLCTALLLCINLAACSNQESQEAPKVTEIEKVIPPKKEHTVSPDAVAKHYADIAHASFQDALESAQSLLTTVKSLTDAPSKQTLAAARKAWKAARVPYMQTEVFRFGNR